MTVIRVDPWDPDPAAIERAAAILRAGRLVAFPTETVYGLGANALDEGAVRRIFEAKGRPAYNPLIAHVAHADAARRWAAVWPDAAQRLAVSFWPGPLTLVLPKRPGIPDIVTAGLPTVALRVPAHPIALALLEAVDFPLAAPSANRFTAVSPTTAGHVARGLGARVDLVLDGGPTEVGIESAVIDLSGPLPVLLRPGALPVARIRSLVGELREPAAPASPTAPRPAPGMLDRHYAPRAELQIFDAEEREEMADAARRAQRRGLTVGALLLEPIDHAVEHAVRMPADPAGYARALYAALHSLDEAGCDLILVERVPDAPGWEGVADRLRRAAMA